jgi:hypothetical protein
VLAGLCAGCAYCIIRVLGEEREEKIEHFFLWLLPHSSTCVHSVM